MTDKKPNDYDELFPGRFLKAGLFAGKHVTLTIAAVDIEPLPQDRGGERVRGVLSFKETDKQLVLNSTNGQCFKAMFGRKVQEWPGHRVTLCSEKDKFGKETVDAVRVYGSPELEQDKSIDISLPRKKPRERVLRATRTQARRQEPPPDPNNDGR